MLRTLVIDDNESLQVFLLRSLPKELETEVVCANDGDSALRLLSLGSFDVAVLDWSLPDMSASVFLERLRSRGICIPVVLMTGTDEAQAVESLLRDGLVDALLMKPCQVSVLAGTLKRVLSREREEAVSVSRVRGFDRHKASNHLMAVAAGLRAFEAAEARRCVEEYIPTLLRLVFATVDELGSGRSEDNEGS
ncbi:MAG: response regulator [Myxococcota bacterium]|jgi:CheY-like chemotaxis protein|nr:response regulator [Myxococcota bacterium]